MAIARSTPAQKPRGLASSSCISRASMRTPLPQAVEDQQSGADSDRAVGDVERRKRIQPRQSCRTSRQEIMEQQEIDHFPDSRPIPQITQRPAEDQAQAPAVQAVSASAQQPDDESGRSDCKCAEQIPLPARGTAEEAECCAGIKGKDDAEKRRDSPLRSGAQ